MGKSIDNVIRKAVNIDGEEKSLDYYIGTERLINRAIRVFRSFLSDAYISYEIERLSAFENNN